MRSARTNSASFDHFTAELQRVSGNCSVPPEAACGPEFTRAGKGETSSDPASDCVEYVLTNPECQRTRVIVHNI